MIQDNKATEKSKISPDELRDLGIALLENGIKEKNKETQDRGISLLLKSHKDGDAEATAWIGLFLYNGLIDLSSSDPQSEGINLLYYSAKMGCLKARAILNRLCVERYQDKMGYESISSNSSGPLVDFEGKRIRIDRHGLFTPVDARLKYDNGINRLTFSLNLTFIDDDLKNPSLFEKTVMAGIKEWEGEYTVFGGQHLEVVIELTSEFRLTDTVSVLAIGDKIETKMRRTADVFGSESAKKNYASILQDKRSAALGGMRGWSTRSLKCIYICSENGKFDDLYEIKHVAKHEFGHVLGLGDLYEEEDDGRPGVEKGSYPELDGFHICDRFYNLVMCDHHGPISNNDIEMVVLAYRENKMQLYQNSKNISKALGKGN